MKPRLWAPIVELANSNFRYKVVGEEGKTLQAVMLVL